jgi:hypothetical protein
MTRQPDGGMYSIKLVHPRHLNHSCFRPDPRHPEARRWMNFSTRGHTPAIAASIRPNHRALVYVTQHKKFIWAIEYTGGVQQGQQIPASPLPALSVPTEWSKNLLPIRFVAYFTDLDSAPDAQSVLREAGVRFTPNAFPMKHISAAEYRRLFEALWGEVAPTPTAST